jgi:hypothetical protein
MVANSWSFTRLFYSRSPAGVVGPEENKARTSARRAMGEMQKGLPGASEWHVAAFDRDPAVVAE